MSLEPRKRILLVAFCCDPHGTMEERNGWHRALIAAQKYHVTVLYHPKNPPTDMESQVPVELAGHLLFIPIKLSGILGRWILGEKAFYFAYRAWHRKAFEVGRQLHCESPFQLTHLVTLCGFREPGKIWKLGVVNIWGPIGGSHHFPFQMMGILDFRSKSREFVRTVINYWQLNFSLPIHRAAANSVVLAATKNSAYELERGLRAKTMVDLETGIDYDIRPKRERRQPDEPFRILWAGRLRAWKGLPLLLYALAELPETLRYQVKILGDGESKSAWQDLAVRLGVADRIEWIPWPNYRDTLQYYDWADAFAFTSQRDTSGTGLVEAIAAGCPLMAVNHQGVADLLERGCGYPVGNSSVEFAVSGFRDAIVKLAKDLDYWMEKSHTCTECAHELHWSNRKDWMIQVYDRAIEKRIQTLADPKAQTGVVTSRPAKLDGFLVLVDQGVVSFTNFATILLLARKCDDTVFAAIALGAQFINYSRSALERLLSASYAAFVHSSKDKAALTGSSLTLAAMFSAIVTLVAFVGALLFFGFSDSSTLAFGLITQCLLLPVQMMRDHFRSINLSRFRARPTLVLDSVTCALQLGLLGALVFAGRTDSMSISLAWAGANALFIILWLSKPPVTYEVNNAALQSDLRESWSYSKWLVFGRCLGIASYLFVPWILTIVQGDGQMALFAKAINLVGLSILIVTGLNSYFQPLTVKMFHREGFQAMKRAMNISFAIYSSVLAGLCVIYAMAGYWIINLVYETTDAQQGTLVTLLGLNVLAFSFAVIAGNGLAALKLSRASFWGELANFCVTAVVAVPLIMWRGSLGAALAILTGSLASTAVTLWMLRRSLKRFQAAQDSPMA
jgi:glycosyltransferase involved in cell wall biosynthesis/O-antigen/teichoic acid export membrane protein